MNSASLVDRGAAGRLNTIVIVFPVERKVCCRNKSFRCFLICFAPGLHIWSIVIFRVSGDPSSISMIDLQAGALNTKLNKYKDQLPLVLSKHHFDIDLDVHLQHPKVPTYNRYFCFTKSFERLLYTIYIIYIIYQKT